jgi:hypothetical protein
VQKESRRRVYCRLLGCRVATAVREADHHEKWESIAGCHAGFEENCGKCFSS